MPRSARPRRSVLYIPGANARAMAKGRALAADCLILDMEDSVSADVKVTAREQIGAAIAEGGYGHREIIVRTNSLDSVWGENDLKAVAAMGADAVLLPKVENAEMVRDAEAILNAAGNHKIAIWCMMETPLGMLQAQEVAFASTRVTCLAMGTSDLAKDLHAAHTRERIPFMTSLGLCILAARAARIAILDGVHLDLGDDEGFREACIQGRQLGMDGKTLIHPKTIAVANDSFAPSEEELEWSRRIIEAHGQAEKEGKGVVLVDGRPVESLHVEGARRVVIMAEAIAAMESDTQSAAE